MVTTTLSCAVHAGTGTGTIMAKSGRVSAIVTVTVATRATIAGAHLPFSGTPATSPGAGASTPSTPRALIAAFATLIALALSLGGYRALRGRPNRG